MNIVKIKKHSEKQLLSKLKKITLFKNPEIQPYKKTIITLEKIDVSFLSPTQKYVLKADLKKVNDLYEGLKKFDINLHELNGYVTITVEDENGEQNEIDVTPTIIEESIENNRLHMIINDGMHRLSHARSLDIIPQVVYVRGIDTENYPYYAFPLENGWDDVKDVLEVIPEGYVKKNYRYPDNYKYYFRNFNSEFKNTQGVRKRG